MFFGGVAHLGERLLCKQDVASSILVTSTIIIKESRMHEAGKGDSPRPYSVDSKTYSDNWDTIFGKKDNNDKKEIVDSLDEKSTDSNPAAK